MRILNVVAALSGFTALLLLVFSSHHMQDAALEQAENLRLAAIVLLVSATTVVSIAGRGRLNLIAGALILGGALLFSVAVAAHAIAQTTALILLAPVGGVAMMAGWLLLAFATITRRPE